MGQSHRLIFKRDQQQIHHAPWQICWIRNNINWSSEGMRIMMMMMMRMTMTVTVMTMMMVMMMIMDHIYIYILKVHRHGVSKIRNASAIRRGATSGGLHRCCTLDTLHPHSTLYTPYFYTPPSTAYIPHSAVPTPHSTLYTLHSAPHTPQSTLYTPHSTLYSLHSTLHTSHSTLHTLSSTLTLYALHSTLNTPHLTRHTSQALRSTLYTPYSTLYSFQSPLEIQHFKAPPSTLYTLHFPDQTPLLNYTPHPTLHPQYSTVPSPQSALPPTPHSTVYNCTVAQESCTKLLA